MTKKRQKQSAAKTYQESSQKNKAKKKSSKSGKDASSATDSKDYLRDQQDKIGSIVTKGFDLAEAGINLGINLVNKIGSVAQEQIVEKLVNVGRNFTASRDVHPGEPGMDAPPSYEDVEGSVETEAPSRAMYVENRLPLFPGSPIRVSFSISNDSVSTPKKLHLRIEGFLGEKRGGRLKSEGFSIKPATKRIAPMDFDKFTLIGAIPTDIVSDVYNGWIIITGEEKLKIPVRLTITDES